MAFLLPVSTYNYDTLKNKDSFIYSVNIYWVPGAVVHAGNITDKNHCPYEVSILLFWNIKNIALT